MSKTRLYYGDKCFYRCPYLSTEKFADVGLRAEYHAYCHLSGEPVELTLKGNDAIRTSECKAMSPTALEITKTISIIVDEESAIQCNKECPYIEEDKDYKGEFYCALFDENIGMHERATVCREVFGYGGEE